MPKPVVDKGFEKGEGALTYFVHINLFWLQFTLKTAHTSL